MACTRHAHSELQDGSEIKNCDQTCMKSSFKFTAKLIAVSALAWHAYMRDETLQLPTCSNNLHGMYARGHMRLSHNMVEESAAVHVIGTHSCTLCRLLPLAISSIYEVTFSRETYSAQVAANARHAQDNSHRQIAVQLKDSLYKLQQPALLDAADASADRQAEAKHTVRHVVLKVRSAEPSQAICLSCSMLGGQLLVATMRGRLAIACSGCLKSRQQTMVAETAYI